LLNQQPTLVKTNTDEFYFPQRLIYQITDSSSVLKKLGKLSCVYKHPQEERWLIDCSHESLKVHDWNSHYIAALQRNDPIIFAYVKFPTRNSMHIYLRSFKRVVPTLVFIEKYVPRNIAVATHHDVCFKLVTASTEKQCPSPDDVFADESKIHYSEHMRLVDRLENEMRLKGTDHSKQIDALFIKEMQTPTQGDWLNDLERKRLEVFYTDGVDNYAQMMMVQEVMAVAKHNQGGKLNTRQFFERLVQKGGPI
jgi:hypothetical protein